MSFRKTFALGYPLSILAFIIMAGLFVSTGNSLPNLFDASNTAFYVFAGFTAGIVGFVFALPMLIINELRNEW